MIWFLAVSYKHTIIGLHTFTLWEYIVFVFFQKKKVYYVCAQCAWENSCCNPKELSLLTQHPFMLLVFPDLVSSLQASGRTAKFVAPSQMFGGSSPRRP